MTQIHIKNKVPQNSYNTSLGTIFNKTRAFPFFVDLEIVFNYCKIENSIIQKCYDSLFDLYYKHITNELDVSNRNPISMGKDILKRDFNLKYQDVRIKLVVEEKHRAINNSVKLENDVFELSQLISVLLKLKLNSNSELWTIMNDNDLDALVYLVVDTYDSSRKKRLLTKGIEDNMLALKGLSKTQVNNWHLEKTIKYQVSAGTVWWSKIKPVFDIQFPRKPNLYYDDRELFIEQLNSGEKHLVFICDDNGELVWDLILVERLLNYYSHLSISFVVNDLIVANNANILTLDYCLSQIRFEHLTNNIRFKIFIERNNRSSIDLDYCSTKLLQLINNADVIYVKGVGGFETMQQLPVYTFYGFVVYSKNSQICTGLEKGEAVFVMMPPNSKAFDFKKSSLRNFQLLEYS